jgi:hypothetical protein
LKVADIADSQTCPPVATGGWKTERGKDNTGSSALVSATTALRPKISENWFCPEDWEKLRVLVLP